MAIRYRLSLTLINIVFPPLAVLILAGPGYDCLISCVFFLLAVIPSHIHGFYLSCTYFHRRRKVRAGRWPGGPKYLIESPIILNGGATDAEVARLYRKEHGHGPSSSSSPSPEEQEMLQREKSRRVGTKVDKRRSYRGQGQGQGHGQGRDQRQPQRPSSGAENPVRQSRESQRTWNGYGYGYGDNTGAGVVPPRPANQRLAGGGAHASAYSAPQWTGSANARASYPYHQQGYGNAPVSPVVGTTPPFAGNASHRLTGGLAHSASMVGR